MEEHGRASGAHLEGFREGDLLRDDSVVAYVGAACQGINQMRLLDCTQDLNANFNVS